MPFAGFTNFASCVSKNRNKANPQAYCASIMHKVEGKKGYSQEAVKHARKVAK